MNRHCHPSVGLEWHAVLHCSRVCVGWPCMQAPGRSSGFLPQHTYCNFLLVAADLCKIPATAGLWRWEGVISNALSVNEMSRPGMCTECEQAHRIQNVIRPWLCACTVAYIHKPVYAWLTYTVTQSVLSCSMTVQCTS